MVGSGVEVLSVLGGKKIRAGRSELERSNLLVSVGGCFDFSNKAIRVIINLRVQSLTVFRSPVMKDAGAFFLDGGAGDIFASRS